MKKILVLNSGGFDSIVMLHELARVKYPEAEIHSIHFQYGALNDKQQADAVTRACEELGCVDVKVTLPHFSWSESEFLNPTLTPTPIDAYLEYRNLIFLSYAVSYAESKGIKDIFFATLFDSKYNDTHPDFIKGLNESLSLSQIVVHTPYSTKEKYELFYLAQELDLHERDFFSCDTPKDSGEPCKECIDCRIIDTFLGSFDTDYCMPVHTFLSHDSNIRDKDFTEMSLDSEVIELRVLVNNDCQLSCEHCFYGFKDMIAPELTETEMMRVLDEAYAMGIHQFHFSGKEPLYDEKIFKYTKHLREKYGEEVDFDVVTNGINVPKYAKKMKEQGFYRVCLSVDDIQTENGIRNIVNVTEKALKSLKDENLLVEVFLDIHEGNYDKIPEIIKFLYEEYGVSYFFVRTIVRLGNAKNFPPLSVGQLNLVYEGILELSKTIPEIYLMFNIGSDYSYNVLESEENLPIVEKALKNKEYGVSFVHWNFDMSLKLYCDKYENQLTITPDGFLMGCGVELSSPHYDKLSSGNVRDFSLPYLRVKGLYKSFLLQENICYKSGKYRLNTCPHNVENIFFIK